MEEYGRISWERIFKSNRSNNILFIFNTLFTTFIDQGTLETNFIILQIQHTFY